MSTQTLVPLRTAKALLTFRGETMLSAARGTRMDYTNLCRILAGKQRVTPQFMRRLSTWLGYDEATLFPEVFEDHQGHGPDAA